MSDIVLQGRDIDKYFGSGKHRRQVLFGVDIDVYAGECLAVIGGSGSGKTTLTRVLLGLESSDGGDIAYQGVGIVGGAERLRRQSGLVFQDPFGSLDPRWRIERSVAEPLRLHHPDWSDERVGAAWPSRCVWSIWTRRISSTVFPWIFPAGRRNVRR